MLCILTLHLHSAGRNAECVFKFTLTANYLTGFHVSGAKCRFFRRDLQDGDTAGGRKGAGSEVTTHWGHNSWLSYMVFHAFPHWIYIYIFINDYSICYLMLTSEWTCKQYIDRQLCMFLCHHCVQRLVLSDLAACVLWYLARSQPSCGRISGAVLGSTMQGEQSVIFCPVSATHRALWRIRTSRQLRMRRRAALCCQKESAIVTF